MKFSTNSCSRQSVVGSLLRRLRLSSLLSIVYALSAVAGPLPNPLIRAAIVGQLVSAEGRELKLSTIKGLGLNKHDLTTVDQTISGRVTDVATGGGLPGVSVVVKGTSRGTTTDSDGNYRVTVPEQNVGSSLTLVFS
ncbi:MAG: TonB-dependent receptor plug, partial [Spirosoma sp.]|nr:TonB-dependent receptor plug [Spirosoma sp.]